MRHIVYSIGQVVLSRPQSPRIVTGRPNTAGWRKGRLGSPDGVTLAGSMGVASTSNRCSAVETRGAPYRHGESTICMALTLSIDAILARTVERKSRYTAHVF